MAKPAEAVSTVAVCSDPGEFFIELDQGKWVDDATLQFRLTLSIRHNARPYFRSYGWRLREGKLLAPARKGPRTSWFPMAWGSEEFHDSVGWLAGKLAVEVAGEKGKG